jgi:hypothetical protein
MVFQSSIFSLFRLNNRSWKNYLVGTKFWFCHFASGSKPGRRGHTNGESMRIRIPCAGTYHILVWDLSSVICFFCQIPAEKISAIAEIVQMLHNASLLIGKENRNLKQKHNFIQYVTETVPGTKEYSAMFWDRSSFPALLMLCNFYYVPFCHFTLLLPSWWDC